VELRLNPTSEQKTYFYRASAVARFAWNWGRALNYKAQMFQMAKSLDDRLYRYLALTAIYRGKANTLQKKTTTKRAGN
jgi:Helix-turn-helix domain